MATSLVLLGRTGARGRSAGPRHGDAGIDQRDRGAGVLQGLLHGNQLRLLGVDGALEVVVLDGTGILVEDVDAGLVDLGMELVDDFLLLDQLGMIRPVPLAIQRQGRQRLEIALVQVLQFGPSPVRRSDQACR